MSRLLSEPLFVGLTAVLLTVAAVAAGCAMRPRAEGPAAATEPLGQLYGLQLGTPLAEQLSACGATPAGGPCAEHLPTPRDGLVFAGLRLAPAVLAEAGLLSVRGLRVEDGRLVEIELEGQAADLPRLRRSVFARKGKPTESETYERHGRVAGLSQPTLHTWRTDQATLYFDEQSQSGHPRLRLFDRAWADRTASRR